MKKIILTLIVIVLLIGIVAVSYLVFIKTKTTQGPTSENLTGKMIDNAIKGTLPSMDLKTNPLENNPNINPVDKTNPFSNLKINPFK